MGEAQLTDMFLLALLFLLGYQEGPPELGHPPAPAAALFGAVQW